MKQQVTPNERERTMAHLTPEIHVGEYYTVEIDGETTVFTEESDAKEHVLETLFNVNTRFKNLDNAEITVTVAKSTGVIGRLSASGFLDCTEWQEFRILGDAKDELYSQTRGYSIFTLPARFASAAINDDWSSSDLSDSDKVTLERFIKEYGIIEFIDIIDNEPFFKRYSDLYPQGDAVVRYLARIDENATV